MRCGTFRAVVAADSDCIRATDCTRADSQRVFAESPLPEPTVLR